MLSCTKRNAYELVPLESKSLSKNGIFYQVYKNKIKAIKLNTPFLSILAGSYF